MTSAQRALALALALLAGLGTVYGAGFRAGESRALAAARAEVLAALDEAARIHRRHAAGIAAADAAARRAEDAVTRGEGADAPVSEYLRRTHGALGLR
ncbi:MAG TPA: hypothetical protein PKD10_18400 [Paracoccaceae bacterium]|nr:hypothetical protein [Paracoccaceae bacterium]